MNIFLAAFDTLDHKIFISRLGFYFGFSDTVLEWVSSYFKSGCRHSVIIGETTYNPRPLDIAVPHVATL